MTITKVTGNKKEYLDLLLLADEQEDMVDRYLDKGTMYVLEDDGIKCECVVTDEGNGILEIKNIATAPKAQRKGYAKEAAIAVRDWTFHNTPFNMIYSYMKDINEPSARTAMSYGCKQVDEFTDEMNEITKVFAISRKDWINR